MFIKWIPVLQLWYALENTKKMLWVLKHLIDEMTPFCQSIVSKHLSRIIDWNSESFQGQKLLEQKLLEQKL